MVEKGSIGARNTPGSECGTGGAVDHGGPVPWDCAVELTRDQHFEALTPSAH